jgi:hypothetical protein
MSATPVLDFAGVFAVELLLITTSTKVGGGYDKNLPPRLSLWMTEPLWTIAEHVYDYRVTRQNKRTKKASMQAGRHSIGVRLDHGTPDSSRVDTLSNGFVDGSAAEIRKRLVGRETSRISGTEGLFEPIPEIRQTHPTSVLSRPPDHRFRRAGSQRRDGGA